MRQSDGFDNGFQQEIRERERKIVSRGRKVSGKSDKNT